MKKAMKFLWLVTVMVMLCMAMAMTAGATEYTEGYYTYEVKNSEAIITDVDELISGDVVIIPDTLGGYSVTIIGEGAFSHCRDFVSITIPDSVTTIGASAFAYCSLKSIEIPDSVTSIGDGAFRGCSGLTSIEIPDSVTTIGACAFDSCSNLTSVMIGNSVTTICVAAFSQCSELTSIIMSDSVRIIDIDAFYKSHNITDVYYIGTEEQWCEITICSGNEDLTGANIHYNYCFLNSDNVHSFTSKIITPATHLKEGAEKITCNCGYTYTRSIATVPHSYNAVITEPTCKNDGYITYTCSCGDKYVGEILPSKGHNFNSNKVCLSCGYLDCSCNCHKSGFNGFIWKLLSFFYKLFGTNKICACGISHY